MSWVPQGVQSYTGISQVSFFMVLFATVLVIVALMTIQVKYKGTGHQLDSNRIISAHGRKIAVIVSIIVVYIFLDIGVTISFTTDKETYAVGEIITASINVYNPLPFPIRLWGFSGWIIPEGGVGGVSVTEIAGYAARAASDRANWVSGSSDKGIWLGSYESKAVRVRHYMVKEEGRFSIRGSVKHKETDWDRQILYNTTEFKPVWVSVNSNGITMFADLDDTIDPPKVALFVRNENMYPVRLPVFDKLIMHYGSINSTIASDIVFDWMISHFDIPAMSTERIYSTMTQYATEETPVFYTLYGITVRYPPE